MREGAAMLMNESVWLCVNEIRRAGSRIMYMGICIKRELWSVISMYGPGMKRSEKGKG